MLLAGSECHDTVCLQTPVDFAGGDLLLPSPTCRQAMLQHDARFEGLFIKER